MSHSNLSSRPKGHLSQRDLIQCQRSETVSGCLYRDRRGAHISKPSPISEHCLTATVTSENKTTAIAHIPTRNLPNHKLRRLDERPVRLIAISEGESPLIPPSSLNVKAEKSIVFSITAAEVQKAGGNAIESVVSSSTWHRANCTSVLVEHTGDWCSLAGEGWAVVPVEVEVAGCNGGDRCKKENESTDELGEMHCDCCWCQCEVVMVRRAGTELTWLIV